MTTLVWILALVNITVLLAVLLALAWCIGWYMGNRAKIIMLDLGQRVAQRQEGGVEGIGLEAEEQAQENARLAQRMATEEMEASLL